MLDNLLNLSTTHQQVALLERLQLFDAQGLGEVLDLATELVRSDPGLIMPVRVLNSDGRGDVFTVAKAIRYATANGTSVIDLSLGTEARSDVLSDALDAVTHAGTVVAVGAGNLATETDQYSAVDNCTLSVTAIGSTGVKSTFANYGRRVDVAAPGETIFSAFPPSGYVQWSGTSMATSFVAGQVALLQGVRPGLTAVQAAALIGGTAGPLDELNPAYAGRLGQGLIALPASRSALASGTIPTSNGGMISGTCVS